MPKKYIDQQQIDVDDSGYLSVNIKGQTGGGLTDAELRATAVPVSLASVPSHAVTATDLDIRNLTNVDVVTAELSAVDNAVLDDIALDTEAIKTAVELIDNAIAGTEMQVDVVAALPAGTNAIGKLLQPDIDVTTNTNYVKKYYTSAGAVTDGIIWSPAAGKRWHIHTIYIQISAAATVTLEDDLTAGDSAIWKAELAANAGLVMTFPEKYPWASGEDAADLIVTTSAGNIYITCSGIEI